MVLRLKALLAEQWVLAKACRGTWQMRSERVEGLGVEGWEWAVTVNPTAFKVLMLCNS